MFIMVSLHRVAIQLHAMTDGWTCTLDYVTRWIPAFCTTLCNITKLYNI